MRVPQYPSTPVPLYSVHIQPEIPMEKNITSLLLLYWKQQSLSFYKFHLLLRLSFGIQQLKLKLKL